MAKLAEELKHGYPANPFTESAKLFGKPYFLDLNGGVERWGGSIGFIEIHMQQFCEIDRTSNQNLEDFIATVADYRQRGLDVIMHAPFIRSQEPDPEKQQFLGFDFEWLAVPGKFKDKPVKKFPMGERTVTMNGLEASVDDYKNTIDLAAKAGIEFLTLHVTAPGCFLEGADWEKYQDKISALGEYILRENKGVKLCIETGGIKPGQFRELFETVKKRTGYEIGYNLDTAHLLLDLVDLERSKLIKNGNEKEAEAIIKQMLPELNRQVIDFYRENRDRIHVVHLTQTDLGVDKHAGLEYLEGILTCNEPIIMLANNEFKEDGVKRHLMIESNPTDAGIMHFINAKRGINPKAEIGYDESAVMTMGMPCNGKSLSLDMLKQMGYLGGKNAATVKTDKIREQYEELAWASTAWVTRDRRQIVYEEGFRMAEDAMAYRRGVVFDGSFDQKANRSTFYNLAKINGLKDLYVLSFTCEPEEAKERIIERDAKLTEAEAKAVAGGEPLPEGRLCMRDHRKYDRFVAEFEPLREEEFNSTRYMAVHTLTVDTTSGINSISVRNPDQRAMAMAEALKSAYKTEFGKDYRILQVAK